MSRITENEAKTYRVRRFIKEKQFNRAKKVAYDNVHATFPVTIMKLPILSADEKLVLINLHSYCAQGVEVVNPSIESISLDTSISESNVTRAINALLDADRFFGFPILSIQNDRQGGKKNETNLYKLHDPRPILEALQKRLVSDSSIENINAICQIVNTEHSRKETPVLNTPDEAGIEYTRTPVLNTPLPPYLIHPKGCIEYTQDVSLDNSLEKDLKNNNNDLKEGSLNGVVVVPEISLLNRLANILNRALLDYEMDFVEALVQRYGNEKLLQKLDVLEQMPSIKNVFGALKAALEKDWQLAKTSTSGTSGSVSEKEDKYSWLYEQMN